MTLPAVRWLALVVALLLSFTVCTPVFAQADELQEANQLFEQGQLDRALDRVNAYLAKNPKEARGRFLKGIILTEQNKPNDAIKVFTELTQEFPELRSEERRVGKECRSGWWRDHRRRRKREVV